jgi:hypothetical protein
VTLKRMVASIPKILSVLNLFVNVILICYYCSQEIELATFSKDLLSISKL